jgi:hypothetical protein
VLKAATIAVLALLLTSCGAPRPRPAPPQAAPHPAAGQQPIPAGRVYRIDPSRSELRLLVYRAGPMARFGHNHVIVNRALEGSVNLAAAATESSFSLSVPVAGFVVDDPQARSEEGADFPGDVSEDARSGTLHNMLGDALLDAARFPVITIDSVAVAATPGGPGAPDTLTATVSISVAGHGSRILAPFVLESDSQHLSAHGTLDLRQTVLGLTPFSVMLGALQVQDEMRVKLSVVALAT